MLVPIPKNFRDANKDFYKQIPSSGHLKLGFKCLSDFDLVFRYCVFILYCSADQLLFKSPFYQNETSLEIPRKKLYKL